MARTFTLGETSLSVQPFSARKGLMAGRRVRNISNKVPQLIDSMADFENRYREKHVERLTRSMALTPEYGPQLEDVTEEEWERVGGVIEYPRNPRQEEHMANIFPLVFDLAEDEVLGLLALAVTPNDELSKGARDGDTETVVNEYKGRLLDEARFGDLVDLAGIVADAVKEEFSGKDEAMGKLRNVFQTEETEEKPKIPTSSSPASSTSSPPPTDGESDGPSTAPVGASSAPSQDG